MIIKLKTKYLINFRINIFLSCDLNHVFPILLYLYYSLFICLLCITLVSLRKIFFLVNHVNLNILNICILSRSLDCKLFIFFSFTTSFKIFIDLTNS